MYPFSTARNLPSILARSLTILFDQRIHPSSIVTVGDEIDVQVLEIDMSRERISLSLKATQQDPWEEFATAHQVGELVYGRVTKLVPFGSFVQVGEGIEGLVHISEMSAHHVDLPEQVVTPAEELWVKIIDLDLQRRRISLSIKQAAEGGVVAAEYQEHFGEHAYDDEGNYIGGDDSEGQEAWTELYGAEGDAGATAETDEATPAESAVDADTADIESGDAEVDATVVEADEVAEVIEAAETAEVAEDAPEEDVDVAEEVADAVKEVAEEAAEEPGA